MFRYHLEDDDEEEATLPVAETRVTAQPISFQLQSHAAGLRLKVSEESIRTELCDGPIPDSPKPRSPELDIPHATSDRADLIQRLKRGESPTWIPNRQACSQAISIDKTWSQLLTSQLDRVPISSVTNE